MCKVLPLLLLSLGLMVPAAGRAQQAQAARPTLVVYQEDKTEVLCPLRWGKRPKRDGGPGAEKYVAAWGPCKPEVQNPPADARTLSPSPQVLR